MPTKRSAFHLFPLGQRDSLSLLIFPFVAIDVARWLITRIVKFVVSSVAETVRGGQSKNALEVSQCADILGLSRPSG